MHKFLYESMAQTCFGDSLLFDSFPEAFVDAKSTIKMAQAHHDTNCMLLPISLALPCPLLFSAFLGTLRVENCSENIQRNLCQTSQ